MKTVNVQQGSKVWVNTRAVDPLSGGNHGKPWTVKTVYPVGMEGAQRIIAEQQEGTGGEVHQVTVHSDWVTEVAPDQSVEASK